jgi:hypothetical protein
MMETIAIVLYFGVCLFAGEIVAGFLLVYLKQDKTVFVTAPVEKPELIQQVARQCAEAYAKPNGSTDTSSMAEFCESVIRSYIQNYQQCAGHRGGA